MYTKRNKKPIIPGYQVKSWIEMKCALLEPIQQLWGTPFAVLCSIADDPADHDFNPYSLLLVSENTHI